MNIFILDFDKRKAAQYHVDKHIVKMPLETAQLLCTVHHFVGNEAPYRKTHVNHPCSKWARKSLTNYNWLVDMGMELCYEYNYRYGRVHKCQAIIEWCKNNTPNIPDIGLTSFAQAMPDKYKSTDVVEAYRKYYLNEKFNLFNWKKRQIPSWIEMLNQQSY